MYFFLSSSFRLYQFSLCNLIHRYSRVTFNVVEMGTVAQLCAIAGVASILSIGVFPQYGQFFIGSPGYFLAFIQCLIVEVVLWGVWLVILYPRYFSPLRNLPQPEVSKSGTIAYTPLRYSLSVLYRRINILPLQPFQVYVSANSLLLRGTAFSWGNGQYCAMKRQGGHYKDGKSPPPSKAHNLISF